VADGVSTRSSYRTRVCAARLPLRAILSNTALKVTQAAAVFGTGYREK